MTRIFIGKIPSDSKESHIRQLLEPFGQLGFCEVIRQRSTLLLHHAYIPETDADSGCGTVDCAFMQFKDPKEAEEAITKLDGTMFRGHNIVVQWAKTKPRYETDTYEPNPHVQTVKPSQTSTKSEGVVETTIKMASSSMSTSSNSSSVSDGNPDTADMNDSGRRTRDIEFEEVIVDTVDEKPYLIYRRELSSPPVQQKRRLPPNKRSTQAGETERNIKRQKIQTASKQMDNIKTIISKDVVAGRTRSQEDLEKRNARYNETVWD